MSVSIYSFVNDLNILHEEIKQYYDLVQFNEDKLKGKLGKNNLRKLKKQAAKEDCSDSEILDYYTTNCKKLREDLLQLDEKIAKHLDYQEQVLQNYSLEVTENLPESILTERKTYEEFLLEHLPVDIRKFVSFHDETWHIKDVKLPFDPLPYTAIMGRLIAYDRKITSFKGQLHNLEDRYTIIYTNCSFYDLYLFTYERTNYFERNECNYGKIGDFYYNGSALITQEAYKIEKNLLQSEIADYEIKSPDYQLFMKNNFSFLTVQLQPKKLLFKNLKKYDKFKLLIYKDKIVLIGETGIVILSGSDFTTYQLNNACKGPVILQIDSQTEMKKLLSMVEEGYMLHVLFHQIVGIKGTYQSDLVKKKVLVSPIDLERIHEIPDIDELEVLEGTEINYKVYLEIKKLQEGTYWLGIGQSAFEIIENEKTHIIKIPLDSYNDSAKVNSVKVYIDKVKVDLDEKSKIYYIVTDNEVLFTDKKYYQNFIIRKEE